MIEMKCATCGKKLQAKDEHAGKTLKCPNCQSPVTVPAAAPAAAPAGQSGSPALQPPAPPLPQAAAGQTVVVQVQQPQASGFVGPKKVSTLAMVFWGLIWPGAQYQFVRQLGKMMLFSLLTLGINIFVLITCGIGLIIAVPYAFFLLLDGLVVAGRIRQGPIHPWRFF